MKTNKAALILFIATFMSCSFANATPQDMCAKKNSELTCADLNYTEDWQDGYNCTPCPLEIEDKYSCAKQGSVSPRYNPATTDLTIRNIGSRICENIPTCAQLGYLISKSDVFRIDENLSCTACPFDGNWWACAQPQPGTHPSGGLIFKEVD